MQSHHKSVNLDPKSVATRVTRLISYDFALFTHFGLLRLAAEILFYTGFLIYTQTVDVSERLESA